MEGGSRTGMGFSVGDGSVIGSTGCGISGGKGVGLSGTGIWRGGLPVVSAISGFAPHAAAMKLRVSGIAVGATLLLGVW